MSSAKKPKVNHTEQQQLDFDAVRAYILACPAVPANHPAIAAALSGLEKEQKRLARDLKLQQRFMQDAVTVERPVTSLVSSSGGAAAEHKKEASVPKKEDDDDDEVMSDDWQDITDKASPTAATEVEEANYLGSKVSREAISLMAEYQMQVNSPLAALALALHAGMCTLGFACTGIPEESSAVTGFAKPIRELPKSQLVPAGWDKNPEKVLLRYRKNGVGSIILQVVVQKDAAAAEATLQVTLYPTSAPEPRETMKFAIAEHLNLESWARAIRQQSFVSPTLHYKSLAALMSKFCATFDLGHVADGNDNERNATQKLPYVDTTIAQYPPARSTTFTNHNQKQQQSGPAGFAEPRGLGLHPPTGVPHTIDGAFPDARFRGDFADDLAPGGLTGPHFGRAGNGGMLMGPHHPAFRGPGMGLPGGMQPRFDPFGPPGGPTDVLDPNHPMTRRGGPGSGNPNHDHMRPPHNLGNNNMFM